MANTSKSRNSPYSQRAAWSAATTVIGDETTPKRSAVNAQRSAVNHYTLIPQKTNSQISMKPGFAVSPFECGRRLLDRPAGVLANLHFYYQSSKLTNWTQLGYSTNKVR